MRSLPGPKEETEHSRQREKHGGGARSWRRQQAHTPRAGRVNQERAVGPEIWEDVVGQHLETWTLEAVYGFKEVRSKHTQPVAGSAQKADY